MNAREAERLLGGYATGTLSEAERKTLFAAALEDQELFDALADEEALRELLADPAVKSRLLAALEAKPKVIPFWRRPSSMTLAASLLVAVGATLMLKRQQPDRMVPQPSAPAPMEEEAPAPKATPSTPPEAAKRAPRLESQPRLRKEAAAPSPPPPPAPAPAAAVSAGAAMGAVADQAPAQPRAEANKAMRESQGLAFFAQALPVAPTWIWDHDASGHPRLTVRWGPGGHLYLLERDPNGTRVLAPVSSAQGHSVFAPTGTVPLDLYWLHEPASDPASLPADGPVSGFRARISPLEEKTP